MWANWNDFFFFFGGIKGHKHKSFSHFHVVHLPIIIIIHLKKKSSDQQVMSNIITFSLILPTNVIFYIKWKYKVHNIIMIFLFTSNKMIFVLDPNYTCMMSSLFFFFLFFGPNKQTIPMSLLHWNICFVHKK